MIKKTIFNLFLTISLVTTIYAKDADSFDVYEWMSTLKGEWKLSPADE